MLWLFRIKQVFTGLSDFYKLVLTVFKTNITKSKPQKITYRDYKNYDTVRFIMMSQNTLWQKRKLCLALNLMKYFYEYYTNMLQ